MKTPPHPSRLSFVAQRVACPLCGAWAGEPCRRADGRPGRYHKLREIVYFADLAFAEPCTFS
jgi:hypothetical protein